jgi:hypothetical protein
MHRPPSPHFIGLPMLSTSHCAPAKPRSHRQIPEDLLHAPHNEQPASLKHGPGGGKGGGVGGSGGGPTLTLAFPVASASDSVPTNAAIPKTIGHSLNLCAKRKHLSVQKAPITSKRWRAYVSGFLPKVFVRARHSGRYIHSHLYIKAKPSYQYTVGPNY